MSLDPSKLQSSCPQIQVNDNDVMWDANGTDCSFLKCLFSIPVWFSFMIYTRFRYWLRLRATHLDTLNCFSSFIRGQKPSICWGVREQETAQSWIDHGVTRRQGCSQEEYCRNEGKCPCDDHKPRGKVSVIWTRDIGLGHTIAMVQILPCECAKSQSWWIQRWFEL